MGKSSDNAPVGILRMAFKLLLFSFHNFALTIFRVNAFAFVE